MYPRLNALPANGIGLKEHCRLRFLTLEVHPFYKIVSGFSGWTRNFHIAAVFKDASLAQTLRILTINLTLTVNNLADSDWQDLYDTRLWNDLDLTLSSFTALQRVFIHLSFPHYEIIPEQFRTGMRKSMPLLEECGILTFEAAPELLPEQELIIDKSHLQGITSLPFRHTPTQ